MTAVIIMKGESNLLEIILALRSTGSRTRLLHRRKQQRDENCNNGNDNQQFNERESSSMAPGTNHGRVLLNGSA